MKSSILLLAFAALVFTSCSSAYKSGQTPDDVYYSEAPERKGSSYVEVENREDRTYRHSEDYYEDRYLRYRLNNRYAWNTLDDYYYNPSYAWHYGSYNAWNNPYNSYYCWNSYYNPYYGGFYPDVIIVKPTYSRPPSRPIAFNPSSYNSNPNSKILSKNSYSNGGSTRYNNSNDSRRYNNSNSFGNSVRRIFNSGNSGSSSNSGYQPSNSTPSRSYNPSSSSSSSSGRSSGGSSSSGGGGVSRPAR